MDTLLEYVQRRNRKYKRWYGFKGRWVVCYYCNKRIVQDAAACYGPYARYGPTRYPDFKRVQQEIDEHQAVHETLLYFMSRRRRDIHSDGRSL